MSRTNGQGLRTCPTCATPFDEVKDLGFRDFRWSFDILPDGVGLTDLDAVLERGGRFLVLEFKPSPGTWVPKGQWILFQRLLEHPEFEVWVISPAGTFPTTTKKVEVRYLRDNVTVEMTLTTFKKTIVEWWEDGR